MALITCKECGNEVSSKADACPKCGARVARKAMGCGTLFGVAFLGAVILSALSGVFSSGSGTGTSATSSPSKPPETTEQKAERERKDAAVERAAAGAVILKKTMRDPESFKLESALVIDRTGAVCYDYRAKNGFGGTNVGHAVLGADGKTFKTSEMDGFARLWNKECAGKSGTEAATAIRWFAL
jgi:hypothetical protein